MRAPAVPQANTAELLGWRMRALGLAHDVTADSARSGSSDRIAAAARRLFALQGQDWNAVRWALGVRAPGSTLTDLHDAFADGRLVRSWPMRGTVHVIAAEDIGWVQRATNHRVLPGAAKRRAFIGLDDESLRTMTNVAVTQLSGGKRLTRDALAAAWTQAGIKAPGAWRYHVIWWLCQNQLLVQGPVEAREPLLVLADEWITHGRDLDGDEALAELATRFAVGRGPILEKDLAWWTGLTLREARRSIAAAHDAGRLTAVDIIAHDGAVDRHWADPVLLDTVPAADDSLTSPPVTPAAELAADTRALLLPGFDEHLLGYTERSAMLDPEHFRRIVPGRNGVFRGTIVEHGRVTGTWQRKMVRGSAHIEAAPFPEHTCSLDRLTQSAAAWGAFHGVPTEMTITPAAR